jgi:hypothetical protein
MTKTTKHSSKRPAKPAVIGKMPGVELTDAQLDKASGGLDFIVRNKKGDGS